SAAEKDWLIYLAEPHGERVLVRRIPVGADGTVAAVEAAAVITRESTEALLAGQKIGMEPIVMPAEPGAPPAPATPTQPSAPRPRTPAAPEPRHGVVLSLAYYGDGFARRIPWQSGVRLSAVFRSSLGLYAGLGYVRYSEVNINREG